MRKRTALLLALIGLLLGAAILAGAFGLQGLAVLAGSGAGVLALLWLGVRLFRRFLWRVGRKLAFSYFLIGVLPIPMVVLLVGVGLWLLSGALLGHLFRDTAVAFHREIEETTADGLESFRDGHPRARDGDVLLAYYKGGKRVAGASTAPATWPSWLVQPAEGGDETLLARHVPLVLDPRGRVSMAAAVEGDGAAALGIFQGDLEKELRERSGLWVLLAPWGGTGKRNVDVQFGGRGVTVKLPFSGGDRSGQKEFFGTGNKDLALVDRPFLAWVEKIGPARPLGGAAATQQVGAYLNATPRTVFRQVVSSSAEMDAGAWGLLLLLAFLLFDVYAVASLMAGVMIYSISRATNRLSRVTDAVRRGEFSVRIPVRRQDQLGELQSSYNEMAASLEQLVAAAAQKESLEKELQIARELQQSLLPSSLTTTEAVELASFFEPSAAIGGDYFDLLKLDDGRLVVVIADVSGHGLSAGLRMAMLKAALVMLVEQRLPAEDVFARLNRLVREGQGTVAGRPLVTATLATFDPRTGALELTNAGHPPTYILHGGQAEEILLPSPPLGVLGDRYAKTTRTLEPGDHVIWLSDGLIETADADGEPFGYERVPEVLRGGGSAAQVRDRLLQAVATHSQGQPPADDRTLVVLRYLPAAPRPVAAPPRAAARPDAAG